MRIRRAGIFIPTALCSGCSGWQSMMVAKGPSAEAIGDLFLIFLVILAAVWVAVAVMLMLAVWRKHEARPDPLPINNGWERRTTSVVGAAGVLTGVILVILTGLSYAGQKSVLAPKDAPLTIEVTAHQWWWEATYVASDPSQIIKTANEFMVPVGRPVLLQLKSPDVIHSFWVPNLSGKQDLVPGRVNLLRIEASTPGTFRGQCAEFCGWQHAHMGMIVSAVDQASFERWQAQQRGSRADPSSESARRGEQVFLSSSCVMCHTIRGTPAASNVGPDLTHVASRQTIGAATLTFSKETLAGWINDPHAFKPGVRMPRADLDAGQMSDLVNYLSGLK